MTFFRMELNTDHVAPLEGGVEPVDVIGIEEYILAPLAAHEVRMHEVEPRLAPQVVEQWALFRLMHDVPAHVRDLFARFRRIVETHHLRVNPPEPAFLSLF